MLLRPALSSVVLPLVVGLLANAWPGQQAAAQEQSLDKPALVRSLRDRFIRKPYTKPTSRIQRYQIWGGGRNFVTLVDDEGDFERGNWNSDAALEARLTNVMDKYYETQADTPQFLVLFSAFQIPFPGAFYLPLANDVRGIGYRHSLGNSELFDSTPSSPLEGLIVMNDYRIWDDLGGLNTVFNQELGHRWGAFVHFKEEGAAATRTDLLGRDDSHWSFFMNTGASPMEGNAWLDGTSGTTFASQTHQSSYGYHPLDLYLMGLVPPAQVEPFWFIEQPDLSALGGFGRRISKETGPLYDRQVTIGGVKKAVTIEDVIRAEGNRNPTSARAPKNFKIAFVFMVRRSQQNDRALMDHFDTVLDDVVGGWERATGNRASLEVVSAGPPTPEPKALGEQCEGIYECNAQTSTACIAPKLNLDAGKRCTKRCSGSDPCPEGFCCGAANLVGDPRYCFRDDLNACPPPPPDAGVSAPDAGVIAAPDAGIADGGTQLAAPSGGCSSAQTSAAEGTVFLALMLLAWMLARRRQRS